MVIKEWEFVLSWVVGGVHEDLSLEEGEGITTGSKSRGKVRGEN